MNIIGEICQGAMFSMMISAIINNLMRMWVRFKQNLYGDESYLTHTLPVTKASIYLSKIPHNPSHSWKTTPRGDGF